MKYFYIFSFVGIILSESPAMGAGTGSTSGIVDHPTVFFSDAGTYDFVYQHPNTGGSSPQKQNPKPSSSSNLKPRSMNRTSGSPKADNSGGACDSFANQGKCKPPEEWNSLLCKCSGSSAADGNQGKQNTGDVGPNGGRIPPAIDAAIQKCSQDTNVAKSDCDQDQDAGVQGAQSQISNFAVNMGSNMGIAGACTGIGKLVAGANAAVAYFAQNCSSSRDACVSSCQNARSAVTAKYSRYEVAGPAADAQEQVTTLLQTCKDLDAKIQQATQAINNTMGTLQGAQNCAKQTDPAFTAYCASNPTAIGCSAAEATDCTNPSIAASNPICICKNNPRSASCTGASAKAMGDGSGSINSASTSSTAGGIPTGSPGSDNLMNDASWAGNPDLKASRGASEEVGGKKGGRPLMDGAAGSADGGDKARGGGASGQGIAVNAGFRGGGGGGGGGWGSPGSDNGRGGYVPPTAAQARAMGPNLRDFLPGGGLDPKSANRGLAGISGPDGITGPHSDIWKKVQNRYQIQVERARLIP
jgi:hypothetical protein